ncbi:MAG: hypothetical protein MUP85_13680 [Candidatus Lokiarchaeota archaeon]|nr:hypothetical protein [Candidatus Lokiarchaeota archaeon]
MSEESKLIIHQEKRITPKCEFCGNNIVGSKWNKLYDHINVCQEQPKRFFCSRQCKIKWIFSTTSF